MGLRKKVTWGKGDLAEPISGNLREKEYLEA